MGSCGKEVIKTALIVINIICFLAGGAILAGGLFVRFEPSINKYTDADGIQVMTTQLHNASYVLMAFGAFSFIIGFLGCCGALKENKVMIAAYTIIMLVIFIGEVAGGVYVYANKDTYMTDLEDKAKDYLSNKYKNNRTILSDKAWNEAMKKLECCGVDGPSDFSSYRLNTKQRDVIPEVCCKLKPDDNMKYVDESQCLIDASKNVTNSNLINYKGCSQALKEKLEEYSTVLLGLAIGVGVFQLIVVGMGIYFFLSIRNEK